MNTCHGVLSPWGGGGGRSSFLPSFVSLSLPSSPSALSPFSPSSDFLACSSSDLASDSAGLASAPSVGFTFAPSVASALGLSAWYLRPATWNCRVWKTEAEARRSSAGRKCDRRGDSMAPVTALCCGIEAWRLGACESWEANLRYAGDLPWEWFMCVDALERAFSVFAALRTNEFMLSGKGRRSSPQGVLARGRGELQGGAGGEARGCGRKFRFSRVRLLAGRKGRRTGGRTTANRVPPTPAPATGASKIRDYNYWTE